MFFLIYSHESFYKITISAINNIYRLKKENCNANNDKKGPL